MTFGPRQILPFISRRDEDISNEMTISVSVPARINILGNPTDGLEGDFCTISCAISLRCYGVFEESEDFVVEVKGNRPTATPQTVLKNEFKYNGKYDIVKASIRRLQKESPEFAEKFGEKKFKLTTWTDIPPRSGLGGSSAIINMVLVGLRELYDLDKRSLNDYRLAEICTRVEFDELGFTCGYADRYSTLLGGLAYIDYRDKLYHRGIDEEPYATYERLDGHVSDLPIFVVSSGISRDSGNVHGVLRKRYMDELEGRAEGEPYMLDAMRRIADKAIEGKKRLLEHDWEEVGRLLNENHSLIDLVMKRSGFVDGAGSANNMLVKIALESGALGAKLTGAGGGGCIFGLARPEELKEVKRQIRLRLKDSPLPNACLISVGVSKDGYRVY